MSNNPEEGELESQWLLWSLTMKNMERCGEARVSICKQGWGPSAAPEVRRYLGASPGAPRAAGHGGERHWRWETLESSVTQRGWGGHQYNEQARGGETIEKEAEWFVHYWPRWNRRCRGGEGQLNVSNLHSHLRPRKWNKKAHKPRASSVLSELYTHRATSSAPNPYTYTFL